MRYLRAFAAFIGRSFIFTAGWPAVRRDFKVPDPFGVGVGKLHHG